MTSCVTIVMAGVSLKSILKGTDVNSFRLMRIQTNDH